MNLAQLLNSEIQNKKNKASRKTDRNECTEERHIHIQIYQIVNIDGFRFACSRKFPVGGKFENFERMLFVKTNSIAITNLYYRFVK